MKDKEYWQRYNQTSRRKEYQKDLMARKRAQLKNLAVDTKRAEQIVVDTKNVSNLHESRHGKHRDPEYKKKGRWEKLAWVEGVPVSRPYSPVAVIDIYPDGNFALPPEEQSFLIKKINSAQVEEMVVHD